MVLGVLKEDLGGFFKPKEALKMVFVVRSIRVFSQFSLDPYYEPLPWFMIYTYTYIYIYIYIYIYTYVYSEYCNNCYDCYSVVLIIMADNDTHDEDKIIAGMLILYYNCDVYTALA